MSNEIKRPLDGVVVLEFSQFLAGPVAGLRLSDLGARVIKIEKPVKVPKEVEKTWKTAIIDIVDRSSKKVLKEFTVHKGSKVKFKNYEISVLYIVPHLVIDQGFTSASNEPLNPGILVEVRKEGKLIYKGPIYQKFPEMYNLAVKDIMIILKEIKKSKG